MQYVGQPSGFLKTRCTKHYRSMRMPRETNDSLLIKCSIYSTNTGKCSYVILVRFLLS